MRDLRFTQVYTRIGKAFLMRICRKCNQPIWSSGKEAYCTRCQTVRSQTETKQPAQLELTEKDRIFLKMIRVRWN